MATSIGRGALAICSVAVLLYLSGEVAPAPQRATAGSDARVDRLFDAWHDTRGPGCALGVSRNGAVVYERGYGTANLETDTPIRPSSIFHAASVAKQFTALAVVLLARDGKLSVDDDIGKYVPELPDYGTPITIRHLLTHTSGLRDQWELIGLSRGRFEENRITEADVMGIVPRQKRLNFTPGAEYGYSNTGFTLLAAIVKRVTGTSLRDFADRRIFTPLAMATTHFHDDHTMVVPGRTSAYRRQDGGWRVSIPNYDVYGATNLFTTVGDLLKWEANFDRPVVGDRTLFEEMETPARLTNGKATGYGFGLAVGRYRGVRVVEHDGADAGYRSYVGRFPEQGLAIAVLCNASTADPTALARGVADAYLGGALTPAQTDDAPKRVPLFDAPSRQAATVSSSALAAYAGEYYSEEVDARYRVAVRNSALSFRTGTSDPTLAWPLSADTFDWNGYYTVQFVRRGPRVTGFEVTNARMRRVTFVRVPARH
jgi:CubicO group peptidase (beta-lactamase class C family)